MSLNLRLKRSLPWVALASALALAACSQYQPFDSVGFLRQQYTKEVGPQLAAKLTVPFELDEDVRAALESKLRPAPSELRKINQVLDFIFQQLDLRYSLTPTHDAVGTFHTQQSPRGTSSPACTSTGSSRPTTSCPTGRRPTRSSTRSTT
jgi:hypothetical protein